MIKFVNCSFNNIKNMVCDYYISNDITIDDHWEDFIMNGNCYTINLNNEIIGGLSIYQESNITFFKIDKKYSYLTQEIFHKAKHLESVYGAFVVSGDEFLLSLCLDNFEKIEKSAYLSRYDLMPINKDDSIDFKLATLEDIKTIQEQYSDLFDVCDDDANKESIYIARKNGEIAGFGRFGLGVIRKDFASIGMTVRPEFRRQGIGKNLLLHLKDVAISKGLTPVSGCWYYNHNSLKTQHGAGSYCSTRVLKFKF